MSQAKEQYKIPCQICDEQLHMTHSAFKTSMFNAINFCGDSVYSFLKIVSHKLCKDLDFATLKADNLLELRGFKTGQRGRSEAGSMTT